MKNEDIERVLITEEELAAKVKELGAQISEDYRGKNLLLVGLLKGSVVFMADLMRSITIDCAIDFIAASSYQSGTTTTGIVKIIKDLDKDVSKYDILVVEDILDSGMTLSYIMKLLRAKGPKSVRLCAMLNKPNRRRAPVDLDYSGFIIPDGFVVGYGLDYDEHYRNLPYVGILSPKVYEK